MPLVGPTIADPFASEPAPSGRFVGPVLDDPFAEEGPGRALTGHLAEVGPGFASGAVEAVGTGLRGAAARIEPWGPRYAELLASIERADIPPGATVDDLEARFEAEPSPLDAITGPGPMRRAEPGSPLAALDEEIRFAQIPNEKRTVLRQALRARIEGRDDPLAQARAGRASAVRERELWRAGESVSEFAQERFAAEPGFEDSPVRVVSEGLGSLATGVAVSVAGGPTAGPVMATALFASMGAGEAADRAVEAGASDEQIAEAALLGLGAGSTDVLPVEVLLRRLPVPGARAVGEAVRRFGGARVLGALGRIGTQAAVEAVQEGGQQALQNLIAREVHSPDQRIGEGIVPSAATGGAVGGIAGLTREGVFAIANRRSRSARGARARAVAEVPPPSPADEASPIPTADIQEGRAQVADAQAVETANQWLATEGLPEIGQPVRIARGRELVEGVVTDAWDDGGGRGLTVTTPDGTVMDASLAELDTMGARVEVLTMPPSAEEIDQVEAERAKEADAIARFEQKMAEREEREMQRYEAVTRREQPRPTGEEAEPPRAYGVDEAGVRRAAGPDAGQVQGALAGRAPTPAGEAVQGALAGAPPTLPGDTAQAGLAGRSPRAAGEAVIGALAGESPTAAVTPGAMAGESPTARVTPGAMAGESPTASLDAEAMSGEPVMKADGTPFKTRQGAVLAARNKRMDDAEPVPVPGGWALRRAGPRAARVAGHETPERDRQAPLPATDDTQAAIRRAERETDTDPSEAQAKAGNYRKGRVRVHGLDVAIENPKGSTRRGRDADGTEWEVEQPATYGYVERSSGADGDQVDVYIGDNPDAETVYVIDQVDADTGEFDEHKSMLGFDSEAQATNTYDAAFSDGRGPERRADVTPMSVEEFKRWLRDGDTTRPAAGPIVRKNGQPFATEKSAALAARNLGIAAEPVRAGDGWALRRTTPEEKAAKALQVLPNTRTESFTPDGSMAVETELAVVDAADLIVSHDEQGRPDPRYPADLQPRERKRATSQAQIREIAGKLKPGMLRDSPMTDTGAPIVGPDAAVESGNGRVAAIRLAYRRGAADEYREMVEREAQRSGIDATTMRAPVLVRVRRGGVADRAQFARASNVSAAARMSASERAKADVETAGRDVLEEYARDPRRAEGRFVESLPTAERSAMFDADGRPSRELTDRVRNAVLWQAYGSDSILRAAAEAQDPDSKQLLNALTTAAPQFAEVEDGVKTALNAAVDRIATARARGMNNKQVLEQVIGQQELIADETFDDGARAIARHILERARSGKRMGEYLVELAERARRAEDSQAYGGVDLLGEVPEVDVAVLAGQADDVTAAPVEVQSALLQRPPSAPGALRAFLASQKGLSLTERYRRARLNQTLLNGVVRRIAREVAADAVTPQPKAREVAEAKIRRKDYPDASRLTDIERAAIVVDSLEDADGAAALLGRRFETLDEGWTVKEEFYIDRKVLVRFPNGSIGEVQILTRAMKDAKKQTHKIYVRQREMERGSAEWAALLDRQRRIHAAAVRASGLSGIAETSAYGNAFANQSGQTTDAVWLTSAADSRLSSFQPESSTMAKTRPSRRATAGRASQSNQVSTSDMREPSDASIEAEKAKFQRAADDPGTIDAFDVDAESREDLERLGAADPQVRSWQLFDEDAPAPRQPRRREPARDPYTRDAFDPQGELFQRGGARGREEVTDSGSSRRRDAPPGRVRIRLSRNFDSKRTGVRRDIERTGREVFGERFHVKLAERIEAPDGGEVPGAFDPEARIAYIAIRANEAGMTGTLFHEGLHYLRASGAFSKADGSPSAAWATLERQAAQWRRDYGIDERYGDDTAGMDPDARERLMNEEAIAEALADYATRGKETGFGATVRIAFDRILRFFRAVRNALAGRGFTDWTDIFEAVERGEYGRAADAAARQPSRAEVDRYLQAAWHGSPHRFDRFSTEAIGTGEGAQAYGHGLYFAGKKEVAEHYRGALSATEDVTFSALTEAQNEAIGGADRQRLARSGERFREALVESQEIYLTIPGLTDAEKTAATAKLEALEALKGRTGETQGMGGATYRVDLAPAEDEYLLWDKRFSQQSEKVKAALRDNLFAHPDYDKTGAAIYRALANDMYNKRDEQGRWPENSERAASEALLAAGIRGIKYLDGSSRDRGEGSYNYVIFDDADVSIDEVLLQRGKDASKANKDAFDEAASKWAGVDLRGAADAVTKDKDRMGGLAEGIAAQVRGVDAIKAGNVEVQEQLDQADLNVALRMLGPPAAWSKKFPAIHKLVRAGIKGEIALSNRVQRLNREWDRITKGLSKDEFADLTGLMFLGDAEAHTFTDAELAEFPVTDNVRRAYHRSRRFIDKLGRLVEQHNRDMSLALITRRTKLVRKMAGARGMDPKAFRKLYDERARLLAEQRTGEGDPEVLAERIDAATERLHGTGEPSSAEYAEWAAEADRIQPRIDDTRIRRREGYVPHKFFGQWRVFRQTGVGEDGEPTWEHVAGEHGFWRTRTEAARAANHLAKKDPDARLKVEQVQFVFPEDQATQLSDAAYHRFQGNVGKLLGLEGQDLQDAVRGTARKRFRRRIAGFSQYRKGVAGYSKDLDRVIRTHIGETMRYVSLDRLKFDAINTMEREGLSENRSTVQNRPVLAAAVQQWFRDVNGQKQVLEGQVDQLLGKPWATPLRSALGAGGLTFVATHAAGAPLVAPILGAYVGFRVGRGLAQGGPFKSRAITGAMLGDMSHLKLGMTFNLMSAAVNTTQVLLNTYPVLGARHTGVGIKRFNRAVLSKLRGRPNADWRLMERHDISPLQNMAEGTRHQFMKEGMLSKLSMVWFTGAESFNRGVTFLGALNRAQGEGKTPKEAQDYADAMMLRTQFHYGASNKPELLRNNFARVPLQFKNFVAQQLTFVFGLSRSELPRFLLATVLVAGTLGIPGLDALDALMDWLFDFSPIAAMKGAAIDALSKGELEGGIATFLTRGVPGLAGVDMTGRVGMGDKFLPLQVRDWKGPWSSTVSTAVRHGAEGARLVDHLRNISPGVGNPLRTLEEWQNGGVQRSPWKRNRPEYTMTGGEAAMKAIGARPMREARLQDLRDIERREVERRRREVRRYVDRIVEAERAGDRGEVRRIQEEARAAGVPLSKGSIRRAFRDIETPRAERELRQLPRDMRGEGRRRRDAIERAAGTP